MSEKEENQIVNHFQSEFSVSTMPNADQSANKNHNEIDVDHSNKNLDSNNADDIETENNAILANNNDKIPEAHQFYLPLNFDLTFAGIKSEKEDNEVQSVPLPGILKKELCPSNEDNIECSGNYFYSKYSIV